MRLEINIPDSTRPEYKTKLATLTQQLSAHPELVADIHLSGDAEDDDIQAMFTPERLAIIDEALAEAKNGTFFTAAQVEEHFAQKENSWMQSQRP
jgi:hypothetical protein